MQAVFIPAQQGPQIHAINSRLLPISSGVCLGTMAGQVGAIGSAFPTPATIVGNTFVNQYYSMLHQSPHVVHCFYTDVSRLSRAEAGSRGIVDTAVTQAGIHEKIMSLDLGGVCAEITTVDAHESLSGSVLVMVTGALLSQNRARRGFVQTFFLAPQESGFFVLNDMFRYLDEEPCQFTHSRTTFDDSLANGNNSAPTQSSALPTNNKPQQPLDRSLNVVGLEAGGNHPPLMSEEEASGDNESYDIPHDSHITRADEMLVEGATPQDGSAPIRSELCSSSSMEEAIGDAPKLSYASIVRAPKDGSGAPVAVSTQTTMSRSNTFGDQVISSARVEPLVLASPQDPFVEDPQIKSEGSNCSIYVKNLPLNITQSELEQEFQKFGKFKPEGVNLRNQKTGVCYAFVEYEDASSAQKAIEASSITIHGRRVYVEEKRLAAPRGGGKSRLNQWRGYRNEGTRGRGNDDSGSYAGFSNNGRGSRNFRDTYGYSSFSNNASTPSNYSNTGYRKFDSDGGNAPRGLKQQGDGN